jgi:hypothetical protein
MDMRMVMEVLTPSMQHHDHAELGEWHLRMPERLDEQELADWRAGRNAVYQLAALTVGARLAVADA